MQLWALGNRTVLHIGFHHFPHFLSDTSRRREGKKKGTKKEDDTGEIWTYEHT